ncbi:hypothetical protein BGZ73_008236 [Actinomortierella ambigua]|nr:hypothetical protein BGZ73_008236 [Actinomortierella ambigua]
MPTSVHRVSAGSARSGSGRSAPATTVLSNKAQSADNRPNEGSSMPNAAPSATTASSIQPSALSAVPTLAVTEAPPPTVATGTPKPKTYSIKRKTVLRQIATTLGAAWKTETSTSTASSSAGLPASGSSATTASTGRASTRIRKTTQHFRPSTAPTFTRPSYGDKEAAASSVKGRRQGRLPKPRVSQPKVTISQHHQQLHDAAHASRLHAHGLCQEEFDIFQNYLRRGDLPAYLAVRNTILWLWRTNPKQRLSYVDAFDKTRGLGLHHGLIYPIYEFLVRSGYINFGLFRDDFASKGNNTVHHNHPWDSSSTTTASKSFRDTHISNSGSGRKHSHQKTIAIVGAGIAGIGCARQLNNLFETYRDRFLPDPPPKVVVLEARPRIGGRMHTVELQTSPSDKIAKTGIPSSSSNLHGPSSGQPSPTIIDPRPLDYTRSTFAHAIDLGAQIITGFDNGNPMEIIVRRQLTDLPLYYLGEKPCDLFGPDGKPVDKVVDEQCEEIFNDVLEKACKLRYTQHWPASLLDYLKKRQKQTSLPAAHPRHHSTAAHRAPSQEHRRPRTEHAKQPTKATEAHSAVKNEADRLEASATLGVCMDYFVESHPDFGTWTDHELELIHWHYANLEFANATPLDKLSLKNWDQDDDFEFSGQHCMVAGGYGQVPLALSTGIDIRLNKPVATIRTEEDGDDEKVDDKPESVHIQCRDGTTFNCTAAVITIPLGVLKRGGKSTSLQHEHGQARHTSKEGEKAVSTTTTTTTTTPLQDGIHFEPALPDWKRKAIDHLGFGLLNKLVLVFPEHFWDKAVELFGSVRSAAPLPPLLSSTIAGGATGASSKTSRAAAAQFSSSARTPYRREAFESSRGKFYMFWNCINVSGLPTLVALMAGQSAYESEATDKETLVQEVLDTLGRMFPEARPLPQPLYSIATRWSADEFARGSYSFVGQDGTGHDYDLLARPVKNQLYFAGEATSRHYPATAHGAYLSGLKVASDILASLIGPLTVEGCVAAAAKAQVEAGHLQRIKTEEEEEEEEEEAEDENGNRGKMDVDSLTVNPIVSSASSPLRSFGDAHTEESPPPPHRHHYAKREGSTSSSSSLSSSSTEATTSLGHGFVMPRRRWGRASKKMIAQFVADRSHYKYRTGMLASVAMSDDDEEDSKGGKAQEEEGSAEDEDDDDDDDDESDSDDSQYKHRSSVVNGSGVKRRRSSVSSVASLAIGSKKTQPSESTRRRPGRARGGQAKSRATGRTPRRP